MYNPVRDGCRGGRDLFKWDDVRLMPYKERECYLGASVKLGYLDRGGKWRRKDWWQNYDPNSEQKMKEEMEEVRNKEKTAYMEKLGIIKPKKTAPVTKKLSPVEVQGILKRKYDDDDSEAAKADRVKGLGFEKKLANYISQEEECDPTLNRLEGLGLDSAPVPKKVSEEEEEPNKRNRSRSRDRRHKHHHNHHHKGEKTQKSNNHKHHHNH